MRISLLLLSFYACFCGISYGQSSFYKAKASLKGEEISKIKFYSLDHRYDMTVLNTALKDGMKDQWEIFGGKDGRISSKERNGRNIFAVEMGQEYLEIMPLIGELSVKYNWAFIHEGDTLLLQFPQLTRDQGEEGNQSLFLTTAHKRYKMAGDEQGKISHLLGVENIASFSQIKPKVFHISITAISSDCSEITKVAGAFITILEMHGREFKK